MRDGLFLWRAGLLLYSESEPCGQRDLKWFSADETVRLSVVNFWSVAVMPPECSNSTCTWMADSFLLIKNLAGTAGRRAPGALDTPVLLCKNSPSQRETRNPHVVIL